MLLCSFASLLAMGFSWVELVMMMSLIKRLAIQYRTASTKWLTTTTDPISRSTAWYFLWHHFLTRVVSVKSDRGEKRTTDPAAFLPVSHLIRIVNLKNSFGVCSYLHTCNPWNSGNAPLVILYYRLTDINTPFSCITYHKDQEKIGAGPYLCFIIDVPSERDGIVSYFLNVTNRVEAFLVVRCWWEEREKKTWQLVTVDHTTAQVDSALLGMLSSK